MKNHKKMQWIVVPLLCLVMFSSSVSAQDEESKPAFNFKYGVKAGTTISKFSSEQPHTNYKPGILLGLFLNYPVSENFSLQVESSYFQQGGTLVTIYDHPTMLNWALPFLLEVKNQRLTFHNIEVPVLAKYERVIGGLKVFGVAGPSFGYNLKTTVNADVSARSMDEIAVYYDFVQEENISSSIKSMHYGLTCGAGFETPVGSHSLTFDVRYRYSINNTYPGYSYLGLYQVQGDLKSNSIYFTLGFGF